MSDDKKLVFIRTSGHFLFFFAFFSLRVFLLALAQDIGNLADDHAFLNIGINGHAFFFLVSPGVAILRLVVLWV